MAEFDDYDPFAVDSGLVSEIPEIYKECAGCGLDFLTDNDEQLVCRPGCEANVSFCELCGAVKTFEKRNNKYCSDICKNEANRILNRELYRSRIANQGKKVKERV